MSSTPGRLEPEQRVIARQRRQIDRIRPPARIAALQLVTATLGSAVTRQQVAQVILDQGLGAIDAYVGKVKATGVARLDPVVIAQVGVACREGHLLLVSDGYGRICDRGPIGRARVRVLLEDETGRRGRPPQ